MINALGSPQSLLLLGGTSEIGLTLARKLVADRCRRVVLAGRPSPSLDAAADELRALGAGVEVVPFDATDPSAHPDVVDKAFVDDVDLAVLAFGVLGEQTLAERDPAHAVEIATTNYVGGLSTLVPVSQAMQRQGHGAIVVLSSVAGERPRKSNFAYGSSKAGLDAFATGLGDVLRGTGVHLLVVRPGFVRTKMTAGLEPAPLSTTPEQVADAIVSGLRRHRETIWVPGTLRFVMSALRHVPRPIFRKLPI
ncbi:decaprenylphospho-beta-D-erythro-pentofuranosid-2-ulose 2-reductase [Cryptosporangium phraense]|uniref:Decaprenylphospho-beta-D-erythro-pentofuranosid-2-ulose 2-reductase n=1 Tax=Cryptosporangium phraense TaxID=2593070 RepID=A0A545AY68_9ACTN|nr:decaprenylphospho-beta-D-erythro-pentofuranosid-2-ulose 2-reductase [Cryptosporangium phraense]TQS46282.1 decaprenylphospho-beta-D-erythro-pentofuranosid-2-ulose 2-reductase [Cryptosporangium phraense]